MAHLGNYGGNPCTGCHTAGTITGAAIFVGVDGVDETADDMTINVTEGDTIEIDYYFTGCKGSKDDSVGVQVDLPAANWITGTLGVDAGVGTAGTEPAGWGSWSTAWDASDGLAFWEQTSATNIFLLNYTATVWDMGQGTACDDDAACGNDQDNMVDTMGADIRVYVPPGTAAGSPYTITLHGVGHDGNSRMSHSTTLTVNVSAGADVTAPTIDAITPANVDYNGTHVDASFDLSASITEAYTLTSCDYQVNGGAWTGGTVGGSAPNWSCTVTGGLGPYADGTALVLNFRGTDNSANTGTGTAINRTVDALAPATGDDAPAGWQTADVTVTLSPTDAGSGVAGTEYCVDSTDSCIPGTAGTSVNVTQGAGTAGTQYVRYRSTDNVGNVEAIQSSGPIQIDKAFPSTTDDAPAGWQGADVTVTLTPSDTGSGLAATEYCIDTTDSCVPSISGTSANVTQGVNTEGTQYVRYRSTDNAGNVETTQSSGAVQIDKKGPTDGSLTVTPVDSQNNLSWTAASDAGSGLRGANTYDVRFVTGGSPPADCAAGTSIYTGTLLSFNHGSLSNGTTYSYRVCAYDAMNNPSAGATGSGTPTAAADVIDPTDGATFTATPGDSQVSLSWDAASDNVGVDHYRVVFSTVATPSAQCTDGTEAYNGAGTSTTHSSLSNSTTYYYRVCAYDAAANVSSGLTANATPAAAAVNSTSAGTASAVIGNTVIDVTAPYTDDDNGDNTLLIEWGLDGVDCSLGSQPLGHAASPYSYQITGLTNGQAYQVCVTYVDGDTVIGTNPQTLTGLTPIAYNPMVHSSASTGSTKWAGDGGWGVSGGKYGEFTCGTCHVRGATNIKRIRTSVAAPNGTDQFPIESDTGTIAFLDTRDNSSDFGDDTGGHATSDKICEGCHSQNLFHNYDTTNNTGGTDHANQQDCMTCHPHSNGFKGAGCDGCHGNPPVTADTDGSTSTGLVHNPNPTGGTSPASPGAHNLHANTKSMGCNTCHKGNTMPTVSNTIQMGFDVSSGNWSGFGDTVTTGSLDVPQDANLTNSFTYLASSAGTTVNKQNINNPSCTIYCHGNWTGSGGSNTTPSWVGGAAEAACGTCHGASAGNPPTAGSHPEHAGSGGLGLACNSCHPNYADTTHVDGDVAWDVSGLTGSAPTYSGAATSSTGAKAPSGSYGLCSGIDCHDNGLGTEVDTPVWGTVINDCSECHARQPATGSHAEHLAASAVCGDCHDGAVEATTAPSQHLDGNLDVFEAAAGDLGYPNNVAKGVGTWTTCDSASCHDNGLGVAATTPVWGTSVSDCSECHARQPATGSHSVHLAASAVCADCHDGAVEATTAPSQHLDGNLDVFDAAAGDLGYPNNVAKGAGTWTTCTSASCHDNGLGVTVTTPVWGTAVNDCSECHLRQPGTGSHAEHLAASAVCGDCHDGAVEATTAPSQHLDGNLDVFDAAAGDLGYPNNVAKGAGTWTTCTSALCHDNGLGVAATTPVWGTAVNDCSECHARQPATGSHAEHLAASAVCADCHDGAVEATTAPSQHLDGNLDVYDATAGDLGYPNNVAKGAGTWTTCTSASCHDNGLGVAATTPVWGTAVNDCSECHARQPATGSHSVHLAASAVCADCHDGAVEATTAPAQHLDGNLDVFDAAAGDLGYPNNVAKGAGTWTTCDSASCHDNGLGVAATTPVWGTAVNDCSECHARQPATGSHGVHLAASAVCADCHDGAVEATTAPSQHLDGNLDVFDTAAGDLGYPTDVAKGAGTWTTCDSVSCHDNGLGVAATTPVWGTAVNDCSECHARQPATGSHTVHLSGGAVCADCHDGAVEATTAPVQHLDGNLDVFDAAAGDLGYPNNVAKGAGTWTTCTSASCHDDGTGTAATSPAWGVSVTDCSECHARQPVTGSHSTHLTQTISPAIGCGNCHDGAVEATTAPSQHLDGDLDVFDTAAGDLGYPTNVAKGGAPYSSCTTTYCHGDAMPYGDTTGSDTTPLWGASSSGCDFCHGFPPTPAGTHNGVTLETQCGGCHDQTMTNGSSGISDISLHLNGSVEVNVSCTGCHNGGGPGAKLVSVDSPHSTNTIPGSPTCESCHFADHSTRTTGTYGITWYAQTMGTDYTVDGKIYIKSNGATTEAESCWACHEGQNPDISEWDGSSATYDYGSVTTDNLNWFTTSWASANFGYKDGVLNDGMGTDTASTHGTNGGAAGVDQESEVSCTRCHDVHGIGNNGYTSAGAPYLRGSWKQSPYNEDGAPQSTTTYTAPSIYSGTSGEGMPREHISQSGMGGFWIDQNSGNPANGDYSTHAGLCTLCHGDGDTVPAETADRTAIETAWSGHANSVAGGSGGGSNIFRNSLRNGNGTWNGGMWMGAVNSTRRDTGKDYAGSLRNEDYGDGVAPLVANNPRAWNAYSWGATVDDGTTDPSYHKFTCSKCHNPHASRLPKLMITNCLDVVQNSWDNQFTGDGNWSNWTSATLDYSTKEFAYSSTAQNCHRYVDLNGDGDCADANDECGWNTTTPW